MHPNLTLFGGKHGPADGGHFHESWLKKREGSDFGLKAAPQGEKARRAIRKCLFTFRLTQGFILFFALKE